MHGSSAHVYDYTPCEIPKCTARISSSFIYSLTTNTYMSKRAYSYCMAGKFDWNLIR